MSALAWIKSKATKKIEIETLGGKEYEVTRIYFRGNVPHHMKSQLTKECKNLENTETAYERVLFSNRTSCEYWHTSYKEI